MSFSARIFGKPKVDDRKRNSSVSSMGVSSIELIQRNEPVSKNVHQTIPDTAARGYGSAQTGSAFVYVDVTDSFFSTSESEVLKQTLQENRRDSNAMLEARESQWGGSIIRSTGNEPLHLGIPTHPANDQIRMVSIFPSQDLSRDLKQQEHSVPTGQFNYVDVTGNFFSCSDLQ